MELIHKSYEDIMKIVTPIMDNLMEASTEIDYDKHLLNHTERAKKTLTREQLEKMCKSYQAEFGIFTETTGTDLFSESGSGKSYSVGIYVLYMVARDRIELPTRGFSDRHSDSTY